jgi:glutamate-5-semialdehyde dehydrogenase
MIEEIGRRAREASYVLRQSTGAARAAALGAMADELEEVMQGVLDANQDDMAQAADEGITGALIDRLRLDEKRVSAMAGGLRMVASLPDPVGRETGGWSLYNGVRLHRVRVPLGVVAVIYEARPNVTADAAGLCVRSGNAVILRGSSYALRSNMAISTALRRALAKAGLPSDGVQLLEDTSRDGAKALMQATEWVDLLVPRGGPGLIAAIQADATVPTVIDGAGNCHVYVDDAADLDKALEIVINAKVQRPGVCNAAETLLVHEAVADEFLGKAARALIDEGVELRGDERSRSIVPDIAAAAEEDWSTEYLDLIMAVRVVPDLAAAIDHVRRYGTGHTEAIVTDDRIAADTFVAAIDTAVVAVNASTRFTDGEEFGFGAEIGNSTQKLHVRGPMGLESLTSERYVLYGDGQVR